MTHSKESEAKSYYEIFLDLGLQPVTNRFVSTTDCDVPMFPFELAISSDIGLIQIKNPYPIDEIKPRFDWFTCFEPEDHLDLLVDKILDLPGISEESVIGAYSFKDDSTLSRLHKKGYRKTWRIDPSSDLGIVDKCSNVETYQAVFSKDKSKHIGEKYGVADVIIVRHVLEHAYNINDFMKNIKRLVKPDGYIVWEVPDCEQSLNNGDCTMVWEEHVSYFTDFSFKQLFLNNNFEIVFYKSIPYPIENSLIAIVKTTFSDVPISADNAKKMTLELERANNYSRILNAYRLRIREMLLTLHEKYGGIAIFGAGHQTASYISIMGISDLITFVIDDNNNKQGLMMPVGNLKIVGSNLLYSSGIKVCLLGLNPQNHKNVINKHKEFTKQGGIFLSIFPDTELDIDLIK